MRYILAFIIVSSLSSAVFADEEVVLELQTREIEEPFYIAGPPMVEGLRCERISKPEGATAPEGDVAWGKLTLGEISYVFCVAAKDGALRGLYMDNDGNNNFADETPVKPSEVPPDMQIPPYILTQKGFILDKLTGKFKAGESSLQVNMRLAVGPSLIMRGDKFGLAQFWLRVCTAYVGNVKALGHEFTVIWVPGQGPCLTGTKRPISLTRGRDFVIGDKRLSVLGPSVKAGGKVTVQYAVTKSTTLAPVTAPKDLACVIPDTTHSASWVRATAGYIPINGKVFLPKEKGVYSLWFVRQRENASYEMAIGLGDFDVRKKAEIGKVLPLKGSVSVMQQGANVTIAATFTDASWRPVELYKDGEPVVPVLRIVDPEGKEVVRSSWYDSLTTKVPEEFRGKQLEARLEVEKTPFEIKIDNATFKVNK